MREQYDGFVATLPPPERSADYRGGGKVPQGWGWVIGDGGSPDRVDAGGG